MNAPASGVDAYLAAVAAGLPGPRRRRTRILAELRDGLEQAVADQMAAGVPAERAAAVAIDGFGAPDAVADAFDGELATAYARRAVCWFAGTGPLVGCCWLVVFHGRPWRAGTVAIPAVLAVAPLVVVAVFAATATLATTGRLMRWTVAAGPGHAVVGAVVVAVAAVVADDTVIGWYVSSGPEPRLAVAVALAASLARIGWAAMTIHRAAGWRRRLAGRAERGP